MFLCVVTESYSILQYRKDAQLSIDFLIPKGTSYLFTELFGAGASCRLLGPPAFNRCFSSAPDFNKLFGAQGSPSPGS